MDRTQTATSTPELQETNQSRNEGLTPTNTRPSPLPSKHTHIYVYMLVGAFTRAKKNRLPTSYRSSIVVPPPCALPASTNTWRSRILVAYFRVIFLLFLGPTFWAPASLHRSGMFQKPAGSHLQHKTKPNTGYTYNVLATNYSRINTIFAGKEKGIHEHNPMGIQHRTPITKTTRQQSKKKKK